MQNFIYGKGRLFEPALRQASGLVPATELNRSSLLHWACDSVRAYLLRVNCTTAWA